MINVTHTVPGACLIEIDVAGAEKLIELAHTFLLDSSAGTLQFAVTTKLEKENDKNKRNGPR